MDFEEILAQASHNAQKSSKVISQSKRDALEKQKRDKQRYLQLLEKERAEKKLKAPPKDATKAFVIPKKNGQDKQVNISAFLEKQKAENAAKLKQHKQERDELIKKRIQANQGKANKKIASTFGKSAIELQTKYAHNSHREAELFRRQQKEDEMVAKESSKLREGIEKAIARREAVQAHASNRPVVSGARVGNVKADGFASLSSKHESVTTKRKSEEFKTLASTQKPKARPKPPLGGSSSMDFNKLMEQAKQNADIEKAAARAKAIREKRYDLLEETRPSTSKPTVKSNNVSSTSAMFRKPKTTETKANETEPKAQKQSRPESQHAVRKEQRILPGDVRYKDYMKQKKTEQKQNREPSPDPKRPKIDPYKAALNKLGANSAPGFQRENLYLPQRSRDHRPSDTTLDEKALAERRKAAMLLNKDRPGFNAPKPYNKDGYHRHRPSSEQHQRAAPRYNNDDDDEEDYDSEDSFIDNETPEEANEKDIEEAIKQLNRNYDKELWRKRERAIDLRKMTANYRDIQTEERRSAKLAMLEDVLEAQRGSRGL